jgi:hypothetical protein
VHKKVNDMERILGINNTDIIPSIICKKIVANIVYETLLLRLSNICGCIRDPILGYQLYYDNQSSTNL